MYDCAQQMSCLLIDCLSTKNISLAEILLVNNCIKIAGNHSSREQKSEKI